MINEKDLKEYINMIINEINELEEEYKYNGGYEFINYTLPSSMNVLKQISNNLKTMIKED